MGLDRYHWDLYYSGRPPRMFPVPVEFDAR